MHTTSTSDALKCALENIHLGKYHEAQAICETVLSHDALNPTAYYCLGFVQFLFKKYDAAAQTIKTARCLFQSKVFDLEQLYADIMLDSGRWDEWQKEQRSQLKTDSLILRYLEMDIAYSCNLSCKFCSHYSDFSRQGIIDYQDGSSWMKEWAKRITPLEFRVLGGEPMLNSKLCDYIKLAAELWPTSNRAIVTNGFLLSNHPNLFRTLAETNTRLDLSLHGDSDEYRSSCNIEKIKEAGSKYGFTVCVLHYPVNNFKPLYLLTGDKMLPFHHNNPDMSWKMCISPKCHFLHNGRLWKCAPVALLKSIADQKKLSADPRWLPYLEHKGLEPHASDEVIMDYLLNAHPTCGMCPAHP